MDVFEMFASFSLRALAFLFAHLGTTKMIRAPIRTPRLRTPIPTANTNPREGLELASLFIEPVVEEAVGDEDGRVGWTWKTSRRSRSTC